MVTSSDVLRSPEIDEESATRWRILGAAFETFMERGFAAASTLEIATRARVSKRDLYSLVGNKQAMLAACIADRAKRMQMPADLPTPRDRGTFEKILAAFGGQLVEEISEPKVIAVFRLAIAEAIHSSEVAQLLDSIGRKTVQTALRDFMSRARSAGLIEGDAAQLAEQFNGLLWGDLLGSLLLGVANRPSKREIAKRAQAAAAGFLRMNPI